MTRVRLEEPKKEKVFIMLDSGAFSAFTKKTEINLNDYIKYIKDNLQYIDTYVNLDVIPGEKDKKRTADDAEAGARASYQNLQKMKKAGLSPIPVFHRGERWFWLERMLQDREPYIGLSPATNLCGASEARRWLDTCFTYLTDHKGKPLVKTHGFAMSSFPLMARYPWTTCDATSWAQTAAYGSILIPKFKNGKPNYKEAPLKHTISATDRDKGTPSDHFLLMGPSVRAMISNWLENEVGVTVLDCAHDYEARARAIVYFMKKFEEHAGVDVFRHRLKLSHGS